MYRGWQRSPAAARATVILFALITSVAVTVQTFRSIIQDLEFTVESETKNGVIAISLIGGYVLEQLQAAERRLDSVAIGTFALPYDIARDENTIKSLVNSSLRQSRSAGAFQYIDLEGRRWASPIDFPSYAFPDEERAYISFLLNNPDFATVVVGNPFRRRIDNENVLPVARNLYDHKGRQVGIISTEISMPTLTDLLQLVSTSAGASVTLVSFSGEILYQLTAPNELPYRLAESTLAIIRSGPLDGILNLPPNRKGQISVYRKAPNFGVVTIFSRSMRNVLAPWERWAKERIVFAAVFVLVQIGLASLLVVHIGRLHRSRMRLRKSQRSLRENRARFISLFQYSPVPIALIDTEDQRILEANSAFVDQFGYPLKHFIGRTIEEIDICQDCSQLRHYLQSQLTDNERKRDVLLLHRSGRELVCSVSSRIIRLDGRRVSLFSPLDITRQRKIENEIRELNRQLELRVSQRTKKLEEAIESLKSMQAELMRAEKMAAHTLASISHDLQTPITRLRLRADLSDDHALRAKMTGDLDEMQALVEEGITFARSASSARELAQRVVIDAFIASIAGDYEDAGEQLYFACDVHKTIVTRPHALRRIVCNLLDNAFKFGKQVELHVLASENGGVTIIVRDRGPGIPDAELVAVFDPFYRVEQSRNRQTGGTGLGLAIVKQLVLAVAGKIELSNRVNGGLEACLTLPDHLDVVQNNAGNHDENPI